MTVNEAIERLIELRDTNSGDTEIVRFSIWGPLPISFIELHVEENKVVLK